MVDEPNEDSKDQLNIVLCTEKWLKCHEVNGVMASAAAWD